MLRQIRVTIRIQRLHSMASGLVIIRWIAWIALKILKIEVKLWTEVEEKTCEERRTAGLRYDATTAADRDTRSRQRWRRRCQFCRAAHALYARCSCAKITSRGDSGAERESGQTSSRRLTRFASALRGEWTGQLGRVSAAGPYAAGSETTDALAAAGPTVFRGNDLWFSDLRRHYHPMNMI